MTIQANFPAIKPSLMLDFANTKQLDSRITYTRASTASYYDGVTTSKAEENLSINSEVFSSWNNVGITVTDNSTTAPDGNTTADTIAGTSGVSYRANNVSITTGLAYTFSIYAKANTTNFLQIVGGSSGFDGTTWANFDLSSGVVGSKGASATSTITSVGNGWYRCTMTATSTATGSSNVFAITPCEASTSGRFASLVGATSIYVWGAQVEQRSAVSAYTATTTQAITNYIPKLQSAASGVARFDNNPTTGESLGLLIEESRTNLYIYSEQLNNGIWNTFGSVTVSTNTVVAPDGTLTSDTVLPSAATGTFGISQNLAKAASSITYTLSGFSKSAGYDFLIFRIDNGTANGVKGAFNISTATVSTAFTTNGSGFTFVGTSLTSVGNGWVRWSVTFTTDTSTTLRPIIYISNATGDGFSPTSYTANGFSGMLIWGAQLEAGAFATSYIPTVASQVTRAADNASMTGVNFSSWYRADEGTLFIDANGNQPQLVFSNANSGYNNIRQIYRSPSTTQPVFVYEANNGTVAVNTQSMGNTNGLTFKAAYGFKTNDFGGSVNAGTVATDTSGLPALAVDRMGIGIEFGISATATSSGIYRKIAFYPLKITSAQLQALTS